jgi:hypothetical protein
MDPSPRQLRVSSAIRGWFIAGFIAGYGWFVQQPGTSLSTLFLVGAAFQIVIIALRRFVPADRQPEVMNIVEMLADGATIFSFALGVFGGIAGRTAEF